MELYWRCRGVVGVFYILVIVTKTLLLGVDTPGYASVMSAVLFFGGMQMLSIGVLGEYVGRLFLEAKKRPLYIVAEQNTFAENVSTTTSAELSAQEGKDV